jgi:hypothetical protein
MYEVLPKITAKKMDKSPIERVVSVLADLKPQKLRQVGLSFDLAHAKALKSDLAREAENKAKEEAEEAAVKEEGEWEDEDEEDGEDGEDEEDEEAEEEEEEKPEKKSKVDKKKEKKKGKNGKKEVKSAKGKKKPKKEEEEAEHEEEDEEDDEEGDDEDDDRSPDALVIFDAGDGGGEGPGPGAEGGAPNEDAWNAVCVIGLRVYSQGSEVTIELAEPKDLEEGASLTVSS